MFPKAPRLTDGQDGLDRYRANLKLYEHSLRNKFDRQFYEDELSTRGRRYHTLSQKRPAGSEAALFFSTLATLHRQELLRFLETVPLRKERTKKVPPDATPLTYPLFPEHLVHRLHFLERGSLRRERTASLAKYADQLSRQHAQNGDVLLSVAVGPDKVQLFERLVESLGDSGLGISPNKPGSFVGELFSPVPMQGDPMTMSPWSRILADNFQARLHKCDRWTEQLQLPVTRPENLPPVPESLPWDPDPRFQKILDCTQADRLNEALHHLELLAPEERELLFDEVIYLKYLLEKPLMANDIRYLVQKYVASSSIKVQITEAFNRFVELVEDELQLDQPVLSNFPGLEDRSYVYRLDPSPVVQDTPPLSDWRSTREHYYRQFDAFGHAPGPRGRLFVWHPDLGSYWMTPLQNRLSKHFVRAEDAFRREIGVPPIGEGWVSEMTLLTLVRSLVPDAMHQWRPGFLGQQSVDIYVPSINLAIEYQGKQHYEPVKLFGDEDGLRGIRERDDRKRQLLKSYGVRLFEWHYQTPITKEAVRSVLTEHGWVQPVDAD